jgi:competence protein ComK
MEKEYLQKIDHKVYVLETTHTGNFKSKLTTTDGIFHSRDSNIKLLNAVCVQHGSTLEGRMQAVRETMK